MYAVLSNTIGVIVMIEYTTLCRTPELEPHHLMHFSVRPRKLLEGGVTTLHMLAVSPPLGMESAPLGMESKPRRQGHVKLYHHLWRQHLTKQQLYGHLPYLPTLPSIFKWSLTGLNSEFSFF